VIPPKSFFVISGGPLSDEAHDYTHASANFRIAKGEGANGQTPFEVLRLSHPLTDDANRAAFIADEVRFLRTMPRGTSLIFDQGLADGLLPALANNDSTEWCAAWYSRGAGRDGGSPGAVNGPCHQPDRHRCSASGGPKAIPLDQHVFGDLTDPMVISENTNRCSGVTASIALAADMTYQVEVQQPTAVAVQF